MEEQGGIRPGQVSRPKINARLCGEALTGTAPIRLEATAPESSKVRGVASRGWLGRRSELGTSIEEHNSVLKPPYSGYAPSEYLTKPWPTEAPIEAWCPIFYGAYRGFNDYGEAPESPGLRIAREGFKTASLPCAIGLTHRLAVCDAAPRPVTSPDSVRSNEEKIRWTDKFVLDRTFDRSRPPVQDLPRLLSRQGEKEQAGCRRARVKLTISHRRVDGSKPDPRSSPCSVRPSCVCRTSSGSLGQNALAFESRETVSAHFHSDCAVKVLSVPVDSFKHFVFAMDRALPGIRKFS